MDKLFLDISKKSTTQLHNYFPIFYPASKEFFANSTLDEGERLESRAAFLFDEEIDLKYLHFSQPTRAFNHNIFRIIELIQEDINKLNSFSEQHNTYTLISEVITNYMTKENFNAIKQILEELHRDETRLEGVELLDYKDLKAESLTLLDKPKQTSLIFYVEVQPEGTDIKYQMIYMINSDMSYSTEYKQNLLAYVIYNNITGRKPTAYETDILKYLSGNKIAYEIRAEKDARQMLEKIETKIRDKKIATILELGETIKPDYSDKIDALMHDIELMERDISSKHKLILEYQSILQSDWLGETSSATKELHQYLVDNTQLQEHILKVDFTSDPVRREVTLTLGLKAPMQFDKDLYLRYSERSNSNPLSSLSDYYKQLLSEIADNKIKIYLSGLAEVNMTTGKLKVRGITENYMHKGYINNPHWKHSKCPGTLRDPLKNAVRNKHYIPMFHLLVQGVAGINMDDLVILKRFINGLTNAYYNDAEVHKEDGTIVELRDYIAELKSEEVPF